MYVILFPTLTLSTLTIFTTDKSAVWGTVIFTVALLLVTLGSKPVPFTLTLFWINPVLTIFTVITNLAVSLLVKLPTAQTPFVKS